MPRRIANALTLLSAVVCVWSAMVVGRSFLLVDHVTVPTGKTSTFSAFTAYGHLGLRHDRDRRTGFRYGSYAALRWRLSYVLTWSQVSGSRLLGVGWRTSSITTRLILPLWLLPLLTAIAPVRWWWWRRRREMGRGFPVAGA